MSKRLKILLTNDDGIFSKGMSLLVSSLIKLDFADLYIVSPKEEQSGKSMSFSYTYPVCIEQYDYPQPVQGAWSVSGSPVDCVKLALGDLFRDSLPDLVLSGINHGSNSGRNIFYSGTTGAAMEAILSGIPAIAFSQDQHISFFQEENAQEIFKALALYALSLPFSHVIGFNVNFPVSKHNESWKGLRLVITGQEFASGKPRLLSDTGKRRYFSLHDCQTIVDEENLSEEYRTLMNNYIAVTPLLVRNTPLALMNPIEFQQLQEHFATFINANMEKFGANIRNF
ncbi:5'/3'-nucleotidase SurE [Chlamydia avium]|nr:5'/3'-nucleotidase SurE [Chlamydia avium]EPP37704.1 5'/3'-nucleotidase SurE [Chlamydia psittaci 10_743_SC13]EPP38432.1 5'/3'-nucleotidase SurE [Chlamydia avium]VVT42801.1 5'/3'-nucleotidase SurE [Chlamydia avium]